MNAKYLIIGAIGLAMVLAGGFALAQGGPGNGGAGRGGAHRGGPGRGPDGPRPAFGELLAIDGDSWTIMPEIPEKLGERMEDRGRKLPELPDQITFTVTDETKFTFNSEESTADAFNVGDKIVVMLRPGDDGPAALRIADPASAKQFIGERLREFRDQRGAGGLGQGMGPGQGEGRGMGPGQGEGRGMGRGRGPRPGFGVITAIDGTALTLQPEVPPFIMEQMAERGVEHEFDLPAELSVTIDKKTRYMVSGEEVDALPFSVGDSVAVIGGLRPEHPAFVIADYATVEQFREEGPRMGDGFGGPGGPPPGDGPGGPPQEPR